MKTTSKIAAAALVGAAILGAASGPASAAVACNREGACWHVRGNYAYRPEFGGVVHPDHWRWGRHEHYRWREHAGRGYWARGAWVPF